MGQIKVEKNVGGIEESMITSSSSTMHIVSKLISLKLARRRPFIMMLQH